MCLHSYVFTRIFHSGHLCHIKHDRAFFFALMVPIAVIEIFPDFCNLASSWYCRIMVGMNARHNLPKEYPR